VTTVAAAPRMVVPVGHVRLLVLVCTLLLAASGWAAGLRDLLVVAGACAVVVAALLAPELVLALFVAAGVLKAAPWVAAIPVDLTATSAIGVGAAIVVVGARRGFARMPVSRVTALGVALTALVVASALWSPAGSSGLDKALRFQAFALLAIVAPPVLIRTRPELVRLLCALVGFALLIALTARTTPVVGQPLATAGGNEIQLGVTSGFAVVAIAGYLVRVGPPLWRVAWLVAAGYLGYTVVSAGSRGALVATAVSLVYVAVRQLLVERSRLVPLVVAGVAAAALVLGTSSLGGDRAAQAKYRQTLFSADPARILGSRDYLLQRGYELAVEHPFGLGVGGFDAVTGGLQYPHNLVLELGDEEGLIGIALVACLVAAAWRERLRGPLPPRTPEFGVAGALTLLALVESMFSFDLNSNRLLWFAIGLLAALARFGTGAVPVPARASPRRAAGLAERRRASAV